MAFFKNVSVPWRVSNVLKCHLCNEMIPPPGEIDARNVNVGGSCFGFTLELREARLRAEGPLVLGAETFAESGLKYGPY